MDDLTKHILDTAKKQLKESGSHRPVILMVEGEKGKQGIVPLLLDMHSGIAKEHSRKLAKKIILNKKIKRYFFISETWISEMKLGDKLYREPRRDLHRKEALIVQEYTKEKSWFWGFIFKKEMVHGKERIKWLETTETESGDEDLKSESTWDFFNEATLSKKEMIEESRDAFIKKMSKQFSKEFYPKFREAKGDKEKIKVIMDLIEKGRGKIEDQFKGLLEDTEPEEMLIRCPKCDLVDHETNFDVTVNEIDVKNFKNDKGELMGVGLGMTLKCECGHVFNKEESK